MSKPVRRGFSVNVFLPSGDPEGLKIVEKSNWSGRGIVIPRSIYSESKNRPELAKTGVYLLFGPSEQSALPTVYIGEGDPVGPRLEQHIRNKEFWTHAVAFTSKDTNLNKAHVQQLESRLVELAARAKRCNLDNGNMPAPPSLSEVDEAMSDGFLDDVLLCLPILGYSMFESGGETLAKDSERTLHLSAKGVTAKGQETAAGFVVESGSHAVGHDRETSSIHAYLRDLREDLIRNGVMTADGNDFEFQQSYQFASPSTAAGVLLGRAANGRTEWKTADGRTLKEVQEAEAAE